MKILTFKRYNPEWVNEIDPLQIITANFHSINVVLNALGALRPELSSNYVRVLGNRFKEQELQNYQTECPHLDINELAADFTPLSQYRALQEFAVKISSKYLNLTSTYQQGDGTIERLELDIAKSQTSIQYHCTKAFADLLGKEDGIELWKQLVIHIVDERLKKRPESIEGPMKTFIEKRLETISSSEGSDSVVVLYDDFRFLERIDRCMCHDSYEHFNDPEFAYLSYCYLGDVADRRCKGMRRFRRRRSQTLYFHDFCDEFFWDNKVNPNEEQPSFEFMRNLG